MARRESTSVRSWRGIAKLAGVVLLLHAFLSGWLVSCEQIAAIVPELADECIEGMTTYQREAALLGEAFWRMLAAFGL